VDNFNLFPVLHSFVLSGGTIDVGRIDVMDCAAVASDAHALWVVLTRRDGESLLELLQRLDTTLAWCLASREPIDEMEYPTHQ